MFKRFLSIFLVVVMVFLNLSSTVFAATGDITTWFVDGPDNIVSSSDMATPDIVNLTGDMYVIVYDTTVSGSGGPGSSGLPRMLSIEIQSNGTLGAVLDDVDLETGINDTYWPGKPRILAVDDDTVVVVMQNRANNVVAVTADIAGDGTITPLNFLKLHDYGSEDPALIHVSGDVYATAYMWEETPYRALLHTFSVTSAGAISSLNTLTFDTRVSTETFNNFDIVQVSGDVYAIVYLENSSPDNGIIETVSISSDGLTLSTIDSYSFASATGITEPEILSVGGGYYAVVYGYNVDGYLETYQIDNSGNITKTGYIDQLIFETGHLYTPDFDYIGEDVYAITYYDTNPNIKVATVQIESSGAIGDVLIDSEVQDVDPADELYPQPELINVDGSVYALTFVGNNDKDGFLATLEIDSGLSAPIPEYRVWIYVIALVLGFALIWQGQRRFVKT